MFEAAQLGLLYGAGLSLMLGTVFFALIRYGLVHGYKAGVFIALGVVISDLLFIMLAFWFTDWADHIISENKLWVALFGGIFIFLFGLYGLVLGFERKETGWKGEKVAFLRLMGLGFVINSTNPVNFFAWLTIQAILISKSYTQTMSLTFLSSSLVAIFIMEVGIAASARMLSSRLNDKVLTKVNQIIHILFMLIGLYLVGTTIFE